MFLATTAISEFWDTRQELLILGPWCLPYGQKDRWTPLRRRILEDPWDPPGRMQDAVARCERAQERLLEFLADYLNGVHGVRRSPRYWRILLGPWLMGFVSALCDRWTHLSAAAEACPRLASWRLDPADYLTPRNTLEYNSWLYGDEFNLQVYSELMPLLGIRSELRRFPRMSSLKARPGASAWKSRPRTLAAALSRGLGMPKNRGGFFSDLYFDRRHALSLVLASRGGMRPVVAELPKSFCFEPEAGSRRQGLRGFPHRDEFEKILSSCLPTHFPTLFLEGYSKLRDLVLSDWQPLPRLLQTAVGWFSNEYFKLLAAEAVEAGGRLIIAQHGGAYGMFQSMQRERHERAIADEYWTWGWTDDSAPGGAALKRMPNPRLHFPPRRAGSAGRSSRDWILVNTSLPRYPNSWHFDYTPASHRFENYLRDRSRFIRCLSDPARRSMLIRLHPVDFGWGHRARLSDEFPGLRFDPRTAAWRRMLDRIRLAVIDHPQTTFLESLAADIPTLLYWDPGDWVMRQEARPYFDELRGAGILYDDAASAAAAVNRVIEDPRLWWQEPRRQEVRRRFCGRFAYGEADWARIWSRELA
ncbi:MAG: hypothetical protein HY922_17190 [Elusimicrobia bacterium]|nr:hypothetical protein [Elusimicrobiota bacterium]